MTAVPEPLWREVLGKEQPWRRGRNFLIAFAAIIFCGQALALGAGILTGDIEPSLLLAFSTVLFWLLFYFIWIGVHWVRWVVAGLLGLTGFAQILWSFHNRAVAEFFLGATNLSVGCYLGAAPAVYFFSIRQRQTRDWRYATAIGVTFLLVLGSLGSGVVGLIYYRSVLEEEGRVFAANAFRRIFVEHDEQYLRLNATSHLIATESEQLHDFILNAQGGLGTIEDIRIRKIALRSWYSFPLRLVCGGEVIAAGQSFRGPVYLHILIGNGGAGWEIDGVWWTY